MLLPIIKEMGGTKALCPGAPHALHGIRGLRSRFCSLSKTSSILISLTVTVPNRPRDNEL